MVAKEVGLQVAPMVARVVTMVARVVTMVALAQVVTMDGKEVSDMVAEEMALMMYPAYSTTPTSMLLARNISKLHHVVSSIWVRFLFVYTLLKITTQINI